MGRPLTLLLVASASALPVADKLSTNYPSSGSDPLIAGGGGKCSYDYSDHDGKPVVTTATCTITSMDLDSGCDTDQTTRDYARALGGHDGVDDDDAGHILAHRLGGDGTEPTNIFPQAPHDNRGAWREFEGEVYDCLDGTSHLSASATLKWTFHYSSSSDQRPTSMTYATSYHGTAECDSNSTDFDNS